MLPMVRKITKEQLEFENQMESFLATELLLLMVFVKNKGNYHKMADQLDCSTSNLYRIMKRQLEASPQFRRSCCC